MERNREYKSASNTQNNYYFMKLFFILWEHGIVMLNIFLSLGYGQPSEKHWSTECSHIDVSKVIPETHFKNWIPF